MEKNVLILKEYILKCSEVKEHYVCNLLSHYSEKTLSVCVERERAHANGAKCEQQVNRALYILLMQLAGKFDVLSKYKKYF